jgi:hypothetical protein
VLVFLLFSACVVAACLYWPWRRGLAALLILVVWEGALRKWVMPNATNYILFLKDAVLCVVAIKAWREILVLAPLVQLSIRILLGAFLAYACIEVLNPGLPTALIGIYGVKAYLL